MLLGLGKKVYLKFATTPMTQAFFRVQKLSDEGFQIFQYK